MTIIGPRSPSRWGSTFRPILAATVASLKRRQRKAWNKKFKSSVSSAKYKLRNRPPITQPKAWRWGEELASLVFSAWQASASSWCGETETWGTDRSLPAKAKSEERKCHRRLPRLRTRQWPYQSLRSRKPQNLRPVCLCYKWNHRESWPKTLQIGPRISLETVPLKS